MASNSAAFAAAERAIIVGDADTLTQLLPALANAGARHWRGLRENSIALSPRDAEGDARAILLREHHVADWPTFEGLRGAWADPSSPIGRFESAVDAIVAGDIVHLD